MDKIIINSKIKKIKAIYLFGSVIKGNMHQFSDIDICIIGKEDADILSSINEEEGIDVVSFWELPLPVRFRVFKEGKAIFIRDKMYIDKIKIKTLKDYLDIKPLIDRYCFERFGCTT